MIKDFLTDFKNVFNGSITSLLKRYLFLTLYGLFKYLPTPIGDILRFIFLKFFLKKLSTFWIREGITFHFPENISVGKSVISEYVYLNGYGGVTIGDMVLVGANSMFYSHDHDFSDLSKPIRYQGLIKKPIIVKDNVFIGCNVVILGNVTINQGAVIGAGSVVTKDVPENTIVVGVPARVIATRDSKSEILNATEKVKLSVL
ncbi:MAG: acyltransferase [Candidatus Melainabacteria bacterium]|nr:acyltransferase [Candidatus Melainabacteria bacterium]